jgi:DNA-binding CsgD family transcriptional regulator
MFKQIISIIILLFFWAAAFSQNKRIIDSLYAVCNANSNDINSLFYLQENLRFRDSAEYVTISTKGIALAKKNKDESYESLFRSNLSAMYGYKNDIAKRKNELNTALQLCTNGNIKSKGYCYFRVGDYFTDVENGDSALYYLLKAEEQFNKLNGDCLMQAKVYQSIATIYTNKGVIEKQMQYAKLGYKKAQYCGKTDGLIVSMFTLAYAHSQLYDLNHVTNKADEDSSLQLYRKITSLKDAPDLTMNSAIGDAYFNIGTHYYAEDNIKYADSALQNFKKCIATGNTPDGFRTALMNIVQARIFVANKQFEAADALIAEVPIIYPGINTDFYLAIDYAELKARYYEAKGNYKEAAKNIELQMQYKDSLYSVEKLSSIQKVETEFTNYKQQQQLKEAQQEIKAKRKLNYLYISLTALSLLGLIFMFRSYYYRQRDFLKQKSLMEKEKQEAELKTRLKEEEAMNAIMERELAEQDKQMAIQEKLLTEQQKQKLQQELMSNQLQLERKNNFLKEIKEKLPAIESAQSADLKTINRALDKSLEEDQEFELLKSSFENTNPRFFAVLQEKAQASLTKLDLKYCGYIKMGMGTKEIANLMNIEPKSMRMARYRIKQKLSLEKDQDLDGYINSI